jgi:SAM-dependent methyltransferase
MVDDNIKEYWETCGQHYAHLVETENRKIEDHFREYKRILLNNLKDLKDKTVIDYGCGGGFLGELLFKEYGIKKYIGIDIAQRSLDFAKERLIEKNVEFYLLPIALNTIKADVLFCFACLQHIQSEKILLEILKNFNDSDIRFIAIHFKYSKDIIFSNEYKQCNAGIYCQLNIEYIQKELTNYVCMEMNIAGKHNKTHGAVFESYRYI